MSRIDSKKFLDTQKRVVFLPNDDAMKTLQSVVDQLEKPVNSFAQFQQDAARQCFQTAIAGIENIAEADIDTVEKQICKNLQIPDETEKKKVRFFLENYDQGYHNLFLTSNAVSTHLCDIAVGQKYSLSVLAPQSKGHNDRALIADLKYDQDTKALIFFSEVKTEILLEDRVAQHSTQHNFDFGTAQCEYAVPLPSEESTRDDTQKFQLIYAKATETLKDMPFIKEKTEQLSATEKAAEKAKMDAFDKQYCYAASFHILQSDHQDFNSAPKKVTALIALAEQFNIKHIMNGEAVSYNRATIHLLLKFLYADPNRALTTDEVKNILRAQDKCGAKRDLSGLNLTGCDLSDVDLHGTNLDGAILNGVTINSKTDIRACSFHKVILDGEFTYQQFFRDGTACDPIKITAKNFNDMMFWQGLSGVKSDYTHHLKKSDLSDAQKFLLELRHSQSVVTGFFKDHRSSGAQKVLEKTFAMLYSQSKKTVISNAFDNAHYDGKYQEGVGLFDDMKKYTRLIPGAFEGVTLNRKIAHQILATGNGRLLKGAILPENLNGLCFTGADFTGVTVPVAFFNQVPDTQQAILCDENTSIKLPEFNNLSDEQKGNAKVWVKSLAADTKLLSQLFDMNRSYNTDEIYILPNPAR